MKIILFALAWFASGALGSYIADSSLTANVNKNYPDSNLKTCQGTQSGVCAGMAILGPVNLVSGSLFALDNDHLHWFPR